MSLSQKLHALFLLDQQLRGLRKRLDAAERRLRAQRSKLEQAQQQLAELVDQHKHAQAHASTFEHEADTIEARIDRLREQMASVKTNKEYSALLLEVNHLKADKGGFEEQALEQMTKVEGLALQIEQQKAAVAEQQKIVYGAEAEVRDARDEVGERLDEVNTRRDAAAGEVPHEVIDLFERLSSQYDGEALAAVTEESRRHMEYACGGCYMGIPVERLNSLMVGRGGVVQCPSCGRILFLEEELRASIVK